MAARRCAVSQGPGCSSPALTASGLKSVRRRSCRHTSRTNRGESSRLPSPLAAKNVALAGVHAVTIQDTATVAIRDLGAQFYLTEADVGSNRAQATLHRLQDLNPAVHFTAVTTPVTEEMLAGFEVRPRSSSRVNVVTQGQAASRRSPLPQVVVFTDISNEDAVRFCDFCHSHNPPIAFIKAETRGLFASAFCDFGPSFTVLDVDGRHPCCLQLAGSVGKLTSVALPSPSGEQPRQGIIAHITTGEPSMVTFVDDERLEFQVRGDAPLTGSEGTTPPAAAS